MLKMKVAMSMWKNQKKIEAIKESAEDEEDEEVGEDKE